MDAAADSETTASQQPAVLITGARAPAALEWARLLSAAGWRVVMADCIPWVLSRGTQAAQKFWTLPSSRFRFSEFANALTRICAAEEIDLVLPTCEEVFYVAACAGSLPTKTKVFAPNFPVLRRLHSKWEFNTLVRHHGLEAPATHLLKSPQDAEPWLAESGRRWFAKPEFSRFASRGGPVTSTEDLAGWNISSRYPWVLQEFAEGSAWCTYSMAVDGKILAHTAYRPIFTAGRGAAVAFRHEDHPRLQSWVEHFARLENLTGQVSFDFVENTTGQLWPLECNPRATSGIHLLGSSLHGQRQDFPSLCAGLRPFSQAGRMLTIPMLLAKKRPGWCSTFWQSRDVVWSWRDPWPGLISQCLSVAAFAVRAAVRQISLNEALTWDIEWNGHWEQS